MAFFHFKNVRIAGISAAVPRKEIDNLHFDRQISKEYDNARFVEVTGIRRRRYDDSLTTSDLCYKAAKRLMNDLGWDASEIDAIIMVSQRLDYILPATACIMQDRLGLRKECYAEDVQLGCSGWVYGISNVASLLQNGDIRKALLCCGDARDHYLDAELYDPLFGYAGAVTALEYNELSGGVICHYGTDGSGFEAIIVPEGGARNPFTSETLRIVTDADGKKHHGLTCNMNGMDVFSFGISTAPKSIKRLAEKYGFDYSDADYFVFHQANRKMNQMINKKLKLSDDKVPMCMDEFGNTSSASIPLTIVTRLKDKLATPKRLICCGFGVGLSWGTVAFDTKDIVISDLIEVDSDEHML